MIQNLMNGGAAVITWNNRVYRDNIWSNESIWVGLMVFDWDLRVYYSLRSQIRLSLIWI